MDALAGYKYHLALENSVVPDYWTEKLADPFGLVPSNLLWMSKYNSYFPSDSLVTIDIDDFDSTLQILWQLLESNRHAQSIDSIKSARSLFLMNIISFSLLLAYAKLLLAIMSNVN